MLVAWFYECIKSSGLNLGSLAVVGNLISFGFWIRGVVKGAWKAPLGVAGGCRFDLGEYVVPRYKIVHD